MATVLTAIERLFWTLTLDLERVVLDLEDYPLSDLDDLHMPPTGPRRACIDPTPTPNGPDYSHCVWGNT